MRSFLNTDEARELDFDRVHASDIPAALVRRLIDDCPNVVAIKAEGGMPNIMAHVECYRLFGKEVLVTCPLEGDMIPLAQLVPIQFSGTSNSEYFGPMIPRIFALLQKGEFDAATKLYWQLHPARHRAGSSADDRRDHARDQRGGGRWIRR